MNLRKIGVSVAALTLALGVTACSVGQGVAVPQRDVPISWESALNAQNAGMAGLLMGSASWTESEFSSLLTELLNANTGEGNPVESVTAWFEPDALYLRATVSEGLLPAAFGTSVEVKGDVQVNNGSLAVIIEQASAGPYMVEGALLGPINDQINAALAGVVAGIPLSVELGQGTITVGLGQ
jgi:hypothetical protein